MATPHLFIPSTGFGNHGNLEELRKNLRWWINRPAMAGKRRDARIKELTQQIATMEEQANEQR